MESDKLKKAKEYLDARKINRAKVNCAHKYDHNRVAAPPRFDVSKSGNPLGANS